MLQIHAICSLSLNLEDRQSPCIWNIQSLPYDSHNIVAVPRPFGGSLVFLRTQYFTLVKTTAVALLPMDLR